VALVTTIVSTAEMMKVSRIVVGGGITHPFGNQGVSLEEEKEFRKRIIGKALNALNSDVKKTTIFY
jgi:glycine reductase